ncbi:MAG: hypothetical protein Q7S09_05965 [bacterium]|nr:hypothetical protein [bacterium]
MHWANFIHIYQPADQSRAILDAVVNQSYRRIFSGLEKIPSFKLTLNINGALTELLARNGYGDVVDLIRKLAESGRLEFTESAMYHAFLPFLEEREIERQIRKNHAVNHKYFGAAYAPTCFFPPEMAYSAKVARVVSQLGYQTLILDEISSPIRNGSAKLFKKTFHISGAGNIAAVFRERRISNLIMSSIARDQKSLQEVLGAEQENDRYMLTAMDGETFGHHRPGLEELLFSVMSSQKPEQIFVSEIAEKYPVSETPLAPREATWASAEKDLERGVQFFSWKDPKNPVHALQWKFFNFLRRKLSRSDAKRALDAFDRASASDQFFWASAEPWWSIEMIEKGAWNMLEALRKIPGIGREGRREGKELYHAILEEAFRLQRKGVIEALAGAYRSSVRIPFKDRTKGAGKPEVYDAVVEMIGRKMKEAADARSYEKAILWRDALWKLETRNDIYDAVHAVDLLRQEVPEGELERLMDTYKEAYEKILPGQPEPRGH